MFGDAYRGGHERIAALVPTLTPDQLATPVPACPGWTVHDVVAHLAGLADDATAGRLTGIPDDAWTAGQVEPRRGRPTTELVAEWAPFVEPIATALDDRAVAPNIAMDVLVHEADVAEALGVAPPPATVWGPTLGFLAGRTVTRLPGPGTVVVQAGDDTWRGGDDDGPVTTLRTVPYELFRGLFSRRSRTQMRTWADGVGDTDPGPWVDALPVFGPRDDDQPVPAAS